ncbi:DUF805 domain-containing protein [Actinobacillus equuli subsp. equuli]|uniref:Membrane protein n=1 Tax=Actinobacillus equuli TaxID=718 RepID=A0AAX3FI95_ACTEU|nr:DUF805 domain-containing protein [Actinobacillus equuli]AIZ79583.1 membrane protein [Actinobacillus equuli subsp. equuli]WGE43696.1 DUF805 domain-containing protein [Actinobacillus equuli subsp. equuli]WGE54333.1 DUF805 domain-containing protein [Actinobacillus equuli subsp. equuli]VEE90240.1 membrane protein [Actinobacillus equuli]
MNWYVFALKRSFNFADRARRREYGWFHLMNALIAIVLNILVGVCLAIGLENMASGVAILSYLYQFAILIPMISITTRRLHDLGWSGWWQLLPHLIVIVLSIATVFSLDRELGGAITGVEYFLYILTLASIIGIWIFMLFLIFKDGQRFTNKYGEDPKAVKNASEATNSLVV